MTDEEKNRAFVWKQDPAYGRNVHLGEEIDLWLAKEMPDGIVVHPEYYNSDQPDTTAAQ
jgi:hypothetical protein